jgi:Tfp pilus assembly protein PilN
MPATKKKDQINLLPRKGLSSTTAGRVLVWILSTFRIIVIVTEMIVMIAFLSRFWFDAQNTNLNEEIAQKQAVLAAAQNFEREFKKTQEKLKIFSNITASEKTTTEILNLLSSKLPSDVFLTSISISEKNVNIKGTTPNELSVQQLLVNLKSTNFFSNVSLDSIKTNNANVSLMEFRIKMTVN